jgi:ubiquinone/menaquinone biosynthesis C-methylase UbiE
MAQDLMFQEEIRRAVRQAYGAISTGGGEPVARRLYSDQELSEVPAGAVRWAQAGVEGWTQFLRGEMEDIPLPDASVDVVISNGVLNLSARKSRALAEIFRVLGPGGRICIADLTVEGELPAEVANDQSAWAG